MVFITKGNGDKIPIEACPFCGSTTAIEHNYFAGGSYDFHWVYCDDDDCQNYILEELDAVKESDYQKGKERAVVAWNDYCSRKRQEHKQ